MFQEHSDEQPAVPSSEISKGKTKNTENKVYAPSSVTNLFIIVVIRKFLGP
jgi:hypothetical protein